MFAYLVAAALAVWGLSRSPLVRMFFNLRREIRAALRRTSFAQYYLAVRWRELAGLAGFGLALLGVADAEAQAYGALHADGALHAWARVLLWVLAAGFALYVLYVLVDGARLRRRFRGLLARRHRYV